MITAVFIFSVLAAIFGNVFVTSLNLQRKALNTQQIIENTNFIFEAMAKEIRMGQITTPDSGANCETPSATLSFVHPVNGNIVYTLSVGDLHRVVNGTDTVLNSNSIEFTRLQFCVLGSASGDNIQARVTLVANIRTKNVKQQDMVDIQTSLSQRLLAY